MCCSLYRYCTPKASPQKWQDHNSRGRLPASQGSHTQVATLHPTSFLPVQHPLLPPCVLVLTLCSTTSHPHPHTHTHTCAHTCTTHTHTHHTRTTHRLGLYQQPLSTWVQRVRGGPCYQHNVSRMHSQHCRQRWSMSEGG